MREMDRLTARPSQAAAGALFSGVTVQAALVAGFLVTLALWLTTGYRITEQVDQLETRAAAVNERYMRAQSQLSAVRAHILLGAVFVRDALLDPSPASVQTNRKRFTETAAAADRALREYVPVMGLAEERERIDGLRVEVAEFRRSMIEVLDRVARDRSFQPAALLREHVMPQRETVVRVSEQVQTLNREVFVRQGVETSELYKATQRETARRLGLALVLSVFVGLVAAAHSGRLERRVRQQRVRDRRLTEELQRLSTRLVSVQEDERRTIARELHDEVGQALTAVKVELAVAQRACEATGAAPRLERVQSITEDVLHRIRNLSHLLHPALLDDLGLEAALEAYLGGVGGRHGLDMEFTHDRSRQRLAPELETAVYRIVQEAVTNVVAHARATRCQVSIAGLAESVRVTIEDNGSGFDTDASGDARRVSGLGLIGIRERAAQFGGTFSIESAPGLGTLVTVELPARALPLAAPSGTEHGRLAADATTAHLPG
jgi:signal transduction histidine kinase